MIRQLTQSQHAIECKRLTELKRGTWNGRIMSKDSKLEDVKQEMIRLKVNILEICETS